MVVVKGSSAQNSTGDLTTAIVISSTAFHRGFFVRVRLVPMNWGWADHFLHRNRRVHIVSALALTLTLSGTTAAQSAQSYRQQAVEFARSKSWDQAIAAYRKALELSPNEPTMHYELALALRYKGDTRQAVEEFESALRLKPSWAEAHYGLGATGYELRNLPAALKEFSERCNWTPQMPELIVCLRVFTPTRTISLRPTKFSRAVVLKPTAECSFELRGNRRAARQAGRRSERISQGACSRSATRAGTCHAGDYARRQGDHKGALSQFRKAGRNHS